MELTQGQIEHIDVFLIKHGIKFLDVRYELIDHLVSEFEMKQIDDLNSFLTSKLSFIKDFSKNKGKAIHWGYQKQLWKLVFSFFYKPKYILISILVFISTYLITHNSSAENAYKILFLVFIVTFGIGFFTSLKFSKNAEKRLISVQFLGHIMGIQFLLVTIVNQIREYLIQEKILLILFFFFAIILNIAGSIKVVQKRRHILDKYSFLIE